MPETFPLTYVKAHLSELADQVELEHERVTLTRNGRPAAILMSPEDLASLEETLAILSDSQMMLKLREGEAARNRGDTISLDEIRSRFLVDDG